MYEVYAGSLLLYSSTIENLKIFDAKISLEVNKTGSFTFTIYPDHPYYKFIYKLKTIITVYQDDYLLFRGRVLNDGMGFRNEKNIECEGDLAFLIDSIQRPYDYTGSIEGFLSMLITNHNSQVEAAHQFTLGTVTVVDSNNTITRSSIDYGKTLDIINDKLIKLLGGYIRVRHSNGVHYLDYLADFNLLSPQKIEFSKNLLDLKRIRKGEDIATALIPLGAKLKDESGNNTDERLTIKSVNDNVDYIYSQDAVSNYGWIFTTNIWDDVTQANHLLVKGRNYLNELISAAETIELSAADLASIDSSVNSFHIGTYVRVTSNPHGIDQNFLVSKLDIDLLKPASNSLTLGGVVESFTEKSLLMDTEPKKGEKGDKGDSGKDAAVQSTTEPTDKSYMWLDTSLNPPLLKRWNGTEWVVVNDTSETLTLLEQRVSSEIQSSADTITQIITESYYTKGDTDELIASQSATWESTAQGFTMQFDTLKKDIDDVLSNTDTQFEEISKYIRFVDGKILLGEVGNELELQIANDRISFLQNNSEVAYFSNRKLYVTDGEYTNSLTLGNFVFFPRANGNLSFKKIN